jgi:hypothetical protein
VLTVMGCHEPSYSRFSRWMRVGMRRMLSSQSKM